MPGIKVRDNEGFDSAIRRFKRVVEKSGILAEKRRREFYEAPSEKRKRALAAAVKRFRKKQTRDIKGEPIERVGHNARTARPQRFLS